VGLLRCPQCHAVAPMFADRMKNEEEIVPRITVAGGPSNAAAEPGEVGYVPEETAVEETPAPAVEPEPEPESLYEEQSVADLKALCRERGLPAGGSKADLVQRLADDGPEPAAAED
jgi:hypothetical protein